MNIGIDKKIGDKGNFKAFAIASSLYGGLSMLGPMILFGGGGYLLDKKIETGHLFFISGMIAAFLVTNVLLFKKALSLTKEMEKLSPAPVEEEDEN